MRKQICLGAGLLALDVILNGSPTTPPKLSAGGSCGNVLTILGYLGWNSYPVARLANNRATRELLRDLNRWSIHPDYISIADDGSTPIIIHRILKDRLGKPIHRFEFRDPATKSWLPQFKPITKATASQVLNADIKPDIFYFDRMNPGTLDLVTELKAQGTIIYFEPSSFKDIKQFERFLAVSDIVKYSQDRIPNYREIYAESQCFLEIETQGERGLMYRTKNRRKTDQWKTIKSFGMSSIQDAAGAGDWCTAGIIDRLCSTGKDDLYNSTISKVESALQFGQMLGAMNCQYDGARGLMYFCTLKELKSAINYSLEQKAISTENIPDAPRYDISTDIGFSELY